MFIGMSKPTDASQIRQVRAAMEQLLPGRPEREAVLWQLLESAEFANTLAPNAWAVTFEPAGEVGFRLNVGQLEVLVCFQDGVRVNILGRPSASPEIGRYLVRTNYKLLSGEQWAFVGPVSTFMKFQGDLWSLHQDFVRQAAVTKAGTARRGTPFLDTHSAALIRYACEELGQDSDEFKRQGVAGRSRLRIPASELRQIKREHIVHAIADLEAHASHDFGESTDYDLLYEGRVYPPKAVFGIAGRYALGRTLKPEHFTGGEGSVCFRVLEEEGFPITRKQRAFLLTWNPDLYSEESFQEELEAVWTGRQETLQWSVGKRKDLPIGSQLYLMRLGKEPKGIVGYAVSTSEVEEHPHWDPAKSQDEIQALYVESLPTQMQFEPLIPLVELMQRWPAFNWTHQSSGVEIPAEIVRGLITTFRSANPRRYWWVNHKQTFEAELNGGYIWSPKTKANGAFNQTYQNLTLVAPGDIVFSYANDKVQAVGVVTAPYEQADKPSSFGTAGGVWDGKGWMVPIEWALLSAPITPKDYIQEIAPLLLGKNSPIKQDGGGNQHCYLARISDELGGLLLDLSQDGKATALELAEEAQRQAEENQVAEEIKNAPLSATEKQQLTKARCGQGLFRQNVEKREKCCRVTGVSDKRFLVASHIKPWAKCETNGERLDGANGLLLAPHIDKLFDRGWITFTEVGEILFAEPHIAELLQKWGVDPDMNIGKFTTKQMGFLEYHRAAIFRE